MMSVLRAAAAAASLSVPSAAVAAEPDWWEAMTALRLGNTACFENMDEERSAAILPRREALRAIGALLRADSARCPEGPPLAVEQAKRLLGSPDAPDADPVLLGHVWYAAHHGRGMARDPALADRIARLLWLYEGETPAPMAWTEAERQRWLEQPATIALLEARAAQRGRGRRTRIVVDRLATLSLRRDLPSYDPRRAVDLLDEDSLLIGDERRIAFSRLVTSGEHLPPDFARARRALILYGSMGNQATPELRAELLRVGTLAALRTRTPAERGEALRTLYAAAIDDHPAEVAARDRLLRRLGTVPTVTLAPADAAAIPRVMHQAFATRLGYPREGDPEMLAPIRLRGLIAPDGRLAMAQIIGSSGLRRRDRGILAAWAIDHQKADLSATARGRFVWVELPPVDPELPLYPAP